MTQLEGLELRKAALEAAGWTVVKDMVTYTDDGIPEGPEPHYLFNEKTGEMGLMYFTDIDAWQHAPAVESNVDAALKYLLLNDTDYWKLIGPCDGSYYVHIATETETTWISIAGQVDRQSFARAMCRAYLEYKANR